MNIDKLLYVSALSLFVFLNGCGGGGGSDEAKFAGIWSGVLYVVSNTCHGEAGNDDGIDTVNQNGETIVLSRAGSGNVYQGVTTSENGFVVTREESHQCASVKTGKVNPNSFSTIVKTVEYSNVEGDNATVTFTYDAGNCSGNTGSYDSSCKIVRKGNFTRQS